MESFSKLSFGASGWGDELLLGALMTLILAFASVVIGLIIGATCLGGLTYWQDINFSELMSIFTGLVAMMISIITIAIICNAVLILVRKVLKG